MFSTALHAISASFTVHPIVMTMATVMSCVVPISAVGIATSVMTGGIGDSGQCGSSTSDESFDANFKVTGSANEKKFLSWCASQHLDAAQTAGLAGNAIIEAGGWNGTGNYFGMTTPGTQSGESGESASDVTNYLNWTILHKGHESFDPLARCPSAFYQYKKLHMSPYASAGWWNTKVLGTQDPTGPEKKGNVAKQVYSQIAGGSSQVTAATSTADSGSSSSSGSGSSSCGSSSNNDSADGTGSIKEQPGPAGVTNFSWQHCPSDVRQYVHDPEKAGLHWEGSGWQANDGQCVDFPNSYIPKIYKGLHSVYGNGIDIAPGFAKECHVSLTKTPSSGSVVSTSYTPLTAGESAGHTFVCEHVLANGSMLCIEQNMCPLGSDKDAKSGTYYHSDTWDVLLVDKKALDSGDFHFAKPKGTPKWGD